LEFATGDGQPVGVRQQEPHGLYIAGITQFAEFLGKPSFNLFDHPNDFNPSGSTGLLNLSVQANDLRIIQFSARVEF